MKKYTILLLVSILVVGMLGSVYFINEARTASKVQGKGAYVPSIEAGDVSIEVDTDTICWGVDDCMNDMGGNGNQYNEREPNHHIVTSGETLKINYNDKPLPNTITLEVEELPDYQERWSYIQRDDFPLFNYYLMLRSEPSYIELPNEPGTYTYNMLVSWHGNKASIQGRANYRFSITVE
ncbi:hypothetical protein LGQ02_16770 [Bacillus shivajii]|uniref:hypothetical protein n=1 Tax=Bacillus shivajii TaxID=1983719 RepID=UPI001CFAA49E|nr:hypothetical protein [Bacillus shivajii]UCZ52472.1 hypothetical protein LGQ02_16770 [Bacillus shivajii]